MKLFLKTVKILIIILLILFVAGIIFVKHVANSGLPDYNRDIIFKSLTAPVNVYRDSMAMPHIYAENEADLYRATGYVMAQERMWQMDLLRRVTQGRLSEIFGDDFVQTDLLLRSLRFGDKSEQILMNSDSAIVMVLNCFAEGVNAYIEDNKSDYPLEFKILGYVPDAWQPVHSLNLIGYMAWDLKAGWSENVLSEISDVVDSEKVAEVLPNFVNQPHKVFSNNKGLLADNILQLSEKLDRMGLNIFSGSNNWAISGKRTRAGVPILANDMHITFGIPGIWTQMHQVVEGKLNVSGLVLPGQPFVIVGHNDSIAWGMTNTYVDNLDIYLEKTHPGDSNKFLYNNNWIEFDIQNEEIHTKSGDVYNLSYRYNHRGPVVSAFKGVSGKILTMHWVGHEISDEMLTMYKLNRAGNWDEFRDAFRTFRAISQNVVYADIKGNIGLQCCAGVPKRKRDIPIGPLPGWVEDYNWQGMVPFEELPNEYNPDRGYVSSANNRTVDDDYPHHIGTWYDVGYRIERIRELLDKKEVFSIQDVKRIQNDFKSVYSELFISKLLPFLTKNSNWSELELEVIDTLLTWNYELNKGSIAASVSEAWSYNFSKGIFADEMGDVLFKKFVKVSRLSRIAMHELLCRGSSLWADNINTENIEEIGDVAREAFILTIREMQEQYGNNLANWQWGNIHQFVLQHPLGKVGLLDKLFGLNQPAYAVGGSYHTISPYSYEPFMPGSVVHGASHRSIYLVGLWDKSQLVLPTGISGIPSSDFYCNQTKSFVHGNYNTEYFFSKGVRKVCKFEMQFKPH